MRSNHYTLNDFLDESEKQLVFYDKQLSEYDEIIQTNNEQQENLEKQRQDVLLQMAMLTGNDFSAADLERLGALIHDLQLPRLAAERMIEQQRLSDRLAAIEQDTQYIQRDHLADERVGEYVVELKPMLNAYLQIKDEFAPYQAQAFFFEDLIKDKYGTDEYEHTGILRFFNREHLDNWKIGDKLCEMFGVESFLPLRDRYIELRDKEAQLREAVEYYQQKLKYIADLIQEHQEISERIPQLPQHYFQLLGKQLDAFMTSTSPDSLRALIKGYKGLDALAKTAEGLRHQGQYLSDFRRKLEEERALLLAKKNKLDSERIRYRYQPTKYQHKVFDASKMQKRFQRNDAAVSGRFAKYRKTNNLLYNFDNYNTVPSVLADVFWWDVITGNRIDGSFSPSVKEYYETHTHNPTNDYQHYEREVQDPVERDHS